MQNSRLYGIIIFVVLTASFGTGIGFTFAQIPSSVNSSSSNTNVPVAPTNATATNTTETDAVAANQSLLLQSSSSNSSTTYNQTRVIKHDMGETEITGTPERIVILEWVYAEDLLALGVQPVGVADIEGMKAQVNLTNLDGVSLSLSDSVVDVGLIMEPNLETIASLEPDLIIWSDLYKDRYEEMSEIAPTLMFNPWDMQDDNVGEFEQMKQDFMAIADAIGRHDQGVAVLNRMNQTFEEAAATIQASGAADTPFVFLNGYPYEGSVEIRISTKNSQASEIIERIGMENAWEVEYEPYGYSNIGLEDLSRVQNATLFYISGSGDDDVFAVAYKDNPVWNQLNFVEEGRVYSFGEGTCIYCGPISAELLVEKVVDAMNTTATNTNTTAQG
jgi:ABC-type Fe3+-hydroxamate transport system substrate-binding protein